MNCPAFPKSFFRAYKVVLVVLIEVTQFSSSHWSKSPRTFLLLHSDLKMSPCLLLPALIFLILKYCLALCVLTYSQWLTWGQTGATPGSVIKYSSSTGLTSGNLMCRTSHHELFNAQILGIYVLLKSFYLKVFNASKYIYLCASFCIYRPTKLHFKNIIVQTVAERAGPVLGCF